MSVNRFKPHVLIIPEDRADEQLANGFVLHDQVKNLHVMPYQGGWKAVLECFKNDYISYLNAWQQGYVIMLIDFDKEFQKRMETCTREIPEHLKSRVFIVGPWDEPEGLPKILGANREKIGMALADECFHGIQVGWNNPHLKHNENECIRMRQQIREIIFG